MADLKKAFGTDESLEEDGTWEDLGDGMRVRVARSGNTRHANVLERLQRPYRGQIARGSLPAEVRDRITIESLADGVLMDWAGFEENGQPVPYSKANAVRLLTEYKELREIVAALSFDANRFREAEVEAAAKN